MQGDSSIINIRFIIADSRSQLATHSALLEKKKTDTQRYQQNPLDKCNHNRCVIGRCDIMARTNERKPHVILMKISHGTASYIFGTISSTMQMMLWVSVRPIYRMN